MRNVHKVSQVKYICWHNQSISSSTSFNLIHSLCITQPLTNTGIHSWYKIRDWNTLLLSDQTLIHTLTMRSDTDTHSYNEIRHWYTLLQWNQTLGHTVAVRSETGRQFCHENTLCGTHSYNEIRHWYMFLLLWDQILVHTLPMRSDTEYTFAII